MNLRSRGFVLYGGVMILAFLFIAEEITVHATESSVPDTMNAGVATILDPSAYSSESLENITDKDANQKQLNINEKFDRAKERLNSELTMANVQNALNIRADADEKSAKVGYLYKDCGGTILEQKGDWTKLQSGNVIGWAKNEYLLFGEEAIAMAEDVGNWIITIDSEALRVRTEPSLEADVLGLLATDDEVVINEVIDDDWVSVEFDGEIGYVKAEYVDVDFHIDEGETIEVIRAREREEAERKLKENRGAVPANADELKLLGALIYCEAGNQSYEGMLAVGAVVMNRVRSGAYPNTIQGVIYASGQFTPAITGKVARVYAGTVPESCMQAAQEAINGATNVGDLTHFRRSGTREGLIIGDHVFY